MIFTEDAVVHAIIGRRESYRGQKGPPLYARSFCVPRFTPPTWTEMDVCEITPAGYLREFEVKLTRADFRADAKKEIDGERKHARLELGDPWGPAQFFYVVPEGLPVRDLLPWWAGLIEVNARMRLRLVVKAPHLHRQVADLAVRSHAYQIVYLRFHRLLARTRGLIEASDEETPAPLVRAL